jgi:hypothetical protein
VESPASLTKAYYVQENKWFLNSDTILREKQFGFRKSLSAEKALFHFTNEILWSLNIKMLVQVGARNDPSFDLVLNIQPCNEQYFVTW